MEHRITLSIVGTKSRCILSFKIIVAALASVAQLEHCPLHQKVSNLILSVVRKTNKMVLVLSK